MKEREEKTGKKLRQDRGSWDARKNRGSDAGGVEGGGKGKEDQMT